MIPPEFVPVTPALLPAAHAAACEIWREYYTPLLGEKQVAYMLANLQSEAAMAEQLRLGYLYFLIKSGGEIVGYIGVQPRGDTLFLSKLYLRAAARGKGCGRAALLFVETLARRLGLRSLTLTVNKGNVRSIEIYKGAGFNLLRAEVTDIGAGFVMDDYVFEKRLP